jgi:hypothetical protein
MLQAPIELPASPHVIMVGNEKGVSGKTSSGVYGVAKAPRPGTNFRRLGKLDWVSRAATPHPPSPLPP